MAYESKLCIRSCVVCSTSSAFGAEMNADAINSAEPSKKTFVQRQADPAGRSVAGPARPGPFSPGEIDGKFGENAKKALRAYAEAQAIAELGRADRRPLERAAGRRAAGDHELHHRRKGRCRAVPEQAAVQDGGHEGHSETRLYQPARGSRREVPHERAAARDAQSRAALRPRRRHHRRRGHGAAENGDRSRRIGWRSTRRGRRSCFSTSRTR